MILEEERERGASALEPGLETIRQLANQILADVNHVLNPDTLQLESASLARFKAGIHDLTTRIAAEAETLTQRCVEPDKSTVADDLRRVAGSALRLQRMAPPMVDGLVERGAESALDPEETSPDVESVTEAKDAAAPMDTGLILVVDDLEANRSLLSRRLVKQGYTVALAANGVEALALLHERHFDLILLDILMPEMDGMEVLRRTKADPDLAHIPVLMLTALDELDSVVRCIKLGADDYLPKPFPSAILYARVRACLESKRMSDRLRKYAGWLFGRNLFSHALAEPAALTLTRRQRTILFADIRGFTPWSERHLPEEAVTMLNNYFETAEGLWAGSSIIKTEYTGDEIMGVFPSVADAVRIGEAMRRDLGALLARFGLGIGIGIHTGLVIEGLMGGAEVKAYRFVGDTVNTAKRICTEAQTGQLLLSRPARDEAGDLARFGPPVDVAMKGKAELFTIFPLLELNGA